MVDSRVAASGEWGGGLGAVAPAVGEEGPQQVATVLPVDLLLAAVAVAAAGESPTTTCWDCSGRWILPWGNSGATLTLLKAQQQKNGINFTPERDTDTKALCTTEGGATKGAQYFSAPEPV
uniref:Uncharacterized protein n=1 Tax=Anopheles melas TaxID=34690 RepID=A0A182TEK9_9DIPT